MKIEEMLNCLEDSVRIVFRNSNNHLICETISDREGVIPYLKRTVLKWFPLCGTSIREICIFLTDEEGDANENSD